MRLIGKNLLLEHEKDLRKKIDMLDKKLIDEKSQYDKYLKEYQYYEDKPLTSEEYQTTRTLFENIKIKIDNK